MKKIVICSLLISLVGSACGKDSNQNRPAPIIHPTPPAPPVPPSPTDILNQKRELIRQGLPHADAYVQIVVNRNGLSREEMAGLVRETIPQFIALRPTTQQVTRVLYECGGLSESEESMMIELRRAVFEHDQHVERRPFQVNEFRIARNAEDFIELLNFRLPRHRMPTGDRYNDATEAMVVDFFGDFAWNSRRSLRDLENCENYLTSFQASFQDTRDIRDALVYDMQEKRALKPGQIQNAARDRILAEIRRLRAQRQAAGTVPADLTFEEIEGPRPTDANETRECVVCMDDTKSDKASFCGVNGCQMAVCNDCISDHIHQQMTEGHHPIHCGAHGHHHELHVTDAQFKRPRADKSVRTDQDLADFRRRIRENYIEQLSGERPGENYKFCNNPNCRSFISRDQVNNTDSHYHCPACQEEYCFRCNAANHAGITCEQYQARLAERNADVAGLHDPTSNTRPCPYCLSPTHKEGVGTRNEACNHIHCGRCGNDWNWVRGKYRRYSQMSDFPDYDSPRPPRDYRVPGDADYVAGRECAYPTGQGDVREDRRPVGQR